MDRWHLGCLAIVLALAVALAGGVSVGSPTDPIELAPGPQSAPDDEHLPPWVEADDRPPASLSTIDSDRDGEFQVHFINVGQADATLLVTPSNETILIDTGHSRDDGAYVLEYLEAHGIDRIDALVATHPHWDHIGGHPAVIEAYETERDGIGVALDPGVAHTTSTYGSYLDAIEDHDVPLRVVREGDPIDWDSALDVSVLNPPEDERAEVLNDESLVFHVEYGETSVLLPGDAEGEAEYRMAREHGDDLDADLYKAGHHGSDTSSTAPLLERVDPEIAVVSSAYRSPFGHPDDDVLTRLARQDVTTYWTAVHGSVVAVSDGEAWTLRTQADRTTDPRLVRAEPAVAAHPAAGVRHASPDGPPVLAAGPPDDRE
ncbi:ComEC/Rec2 family competence protein [Halovivax gelatinilyticus]|uniref:ComEC/Rec2 family competence protein n=1 Tax=Halovivax gelatinilyticus TaxID=2961597 RepID=UPI0020CA695C|nr:ComEC/Rec2 family competence protein [Halovivax gelatinilyticus]